MTPDVNPNSATPLYKQILKIISDQIASGEYNPGDRLPPEAELVKKYNVSRITIRNALNELVEDGILSRIQGKGTFVSAVKEQYRANDNIGFTRSCCLDGKTPTTKLISAEVIYPSSSQMEFFRIPETERIIRTKRLRCVNDLPTLLETNHYPLTMSFLLNENLDGSLFELLNNKYNIRIDHSIRTLEICFSNAEESELLHLDPGAPLLLFKDKHFDKNNRPLLLSNQVYCTEHLKFYL